VQHTEETKRKVSESLKGNQHTRGRVLSEAEKAQRSASLKGRPKTPEHAEKIAQGLLHAWERRKTSGEFDVAEFSKRMSEQNQGENSAMAKLTANDVREIRHRYADGGVTFQQLSKEYGVANSSISNILTRKTWKHIAD
jgi:hypothetical protein